MPESSHPSAPPKAVSPNVPDGELALPFRYTPVVRADGLNPAERYLQRLCERTFLRLWSYPGVYRDQKGGERAGRPLGGVR
jgi:hypothetical protein